MQRADLIKKISDNLVEIVAKSQARIDLDYYDSTRAAEGFVLKVLNIVCDLGLKDLNKAKKNYPAVDLGNKSSKIAYQVSTNVDKRKLTKTIKTLDKNTWISDEFDTIRFFDFRMSRDPIGIPDNDYGINKESLFYFNNILEHLKDPNVDIDIVQRLHDFVEKEAGKNIRYFVDNPVSKSTNNSFLSTVSHTGLISHLTEGFSNKDLEEFEEEFQEFKNKLIKTSKKTRMLLCSIVDMCSDDKSPTHQYFCNIGQVYNKYKNRYDLDSEHDFLIACSFVAHEELDDNNSLKNNYRLIDNTLINIKYFCEKNEISSSNYIVDLNFDN